MLHTECVADYLSAQEDSDPLVFPYFLDMLL